MTLARRIGPFITLAVAKCVLKSELHYQLGEGKQVNVARKNPRVHCPKKTVMKSTILSIGCSHVLDVSSM